VTGAASDGLRPCLVRLFAFVDVGGSLRQAKRQGELLLISAPSGRILAGIASRTST
jgi:hypothetical protein